MTEDDRKLILKIAKQSQETAEALPSILSRLSKIEASDAVGKVKVDISPAKTQVPFVTNTKDSIGASSLIINRMVSDEALSEESRTELVQILLEVFKDFHITNLVLSYGNKRTK